MCIYWCMVLRCTGAEVKGITSRYRDRCRGGATMQVQRCRYAQVQVQRCRDAELQRCRRGSKVQCCSAAVVQWCTD